ncbi:MAG: hypothetical protein ACI90V_002357, partial [Bacillariaceae sp.]
GGSSGLGAGSCSSAIVNTFRMIIIMVCCDETKQDLNES